ncbi:alpha/beta hydrolase [Paenibacillus thermoaerophilus]|nr:alpha/beta hydrolase [Paenibacillus thermoaerophilus]
MNMSTAHPSEGLFSNSASVSVSINPPRKRASSGSRLLMWIAVVLVALVAAPAIGFHAYVAWILARPDPIPLSSNPMAAHGLAYEDVTFPAVGYPSRLEGWYVPAGNSKRTIVFSHGYGANREEYWVPMLDLTKAVHQLGYNALLFDYGYVYNEKQPVTAGVIETRELLGAIQFAKEKGAEEIFVWGFSMGAGIALQAALQTDDLSGMLLDSTFLLTADTLYHNLRQYVNLPRFPSVYLIKWFFPMLNGVSLQEIPTERVLSTTYDIPIYMMHGKLDDKAPFELAEKLAANQSSHEASGLWLVPDGYHELLFRYHKKEYMSRVVQFLNAVSGDTRPVRAPSGVISAEAEGSAEPA